MLERLVAELGQPKQLQPSMQSSPVEWVGVEVDPEEGEVAEECTTVQQQRGFCSCLSEF